LVDLDSLIRRDEVPERLPPPQPPKDPDASHRLWPLISALALLLLLAAVWGLWPQPSTVGSGDRVPTGSRDAASSAMQASSAAAEHSQAASSAATTVKKTRPGVAQTGATKSGGTKAAASADEPMCSALQERVSIGETLNDADRRLLEKVCR
jgi:hypothetical protein